MWKLETLNVSTGHNGVLLQRIYDRFEIRTSQRAFHYAQDRVSTWGYGEFPIRETFISFVCEQEQVRMAR